MSAKGQKATNRSRAEPHCCPLWSESRQKSAERVCPLSAISGNHVEINEAAE